MAVIRTCKWCGKKFDGNSNAARNPYCSPKCQTAAKKK